MVFKCESCSAEYEALQILADVHKFELGDDYYLQIKKCRKCGGTSQAPKAIDLSAYFIEPEDDGCAGGACKI